MQKKGKSKILTQCIAAKTLEILGEKTSKGTKNIDVQSHSSAAGPVRISSRFFLIGSIIV